MRGGARSTLALFQRGIDRLQRACCLWVICAVRPNERGAGAIFLLVQGFRSWVIRRSHFALDFPIPH